MSIYSKDGTVLSSVYGLNGNSLPQVYDIQGNSIFSTELPIPAGNLSASSIIPLPDIHNTGHGWTCTGLAYDGSTNTFLIGDIGKETPSSPGFASQIVRMSYDLLTVIEQIPLHASFPNMADIQGITIDTSDDTIWFCSTSEGLIRHINKNGNSLGSFSVSGQSPTGIAYSPADDSFWVLTYANKILNVTKTGTICGTYSFAYPEQLDQCFLDAERGRLYIVAGANYSERNNVYLFNTRTHEQSIACTVDSYSVEGIWIGMNNRMIILNDGYYHDAKINVNQANIYII